MAHSYGIAAKSNALCARSLPPISPVRVAAAKTTALIERVRGLLAAGVPARRIMVVTFSPRAAARIAAHLPAQIDAEAAGGLRLQTASRLCMRLLAECYRARSGSGADGDGRGDGESDPPRLLSAIERAQPFCTPPPAEAPPHWDRHIRSHRC